MAARGWSWSSSGVGLASILVLVLGTGETTAQADRSLRYERFDVDVQLLSDATYVVVERQQISFQGTFRSGFREIPLDRVSSITEVALGEPGRPYRSGFNQPGSFAASRSEGQLRIDWWFEDTTDAVRTFELRYRVSGGLRVYSDFDQLSWLAIPASLKADVGEASVAVHLPASVPLEQLRPIAYLDGSERPAAAVFPAEVHFGASNIRLGQKLDVRLGFPHGLVPTAQQAWQTGADRQEGLARLSMTVVQLLLFLATVLVLGTGLGTIFVLWRQRRPGPWLLAEPRIEAPPSDLPPAIVGTLVDGQADTQDVVATLIDLGRRGVVRISRTISPGSDGSDLDGKLQLEQDDLLALSTHEKLLIGGLFRGERSLLMSEVRPHWQANAALFRERLCDEAVQRGLLGANPAVGARRCARSGAALAIASGGLAILLGVGPGSEAPLVWAPLAGLALVGVTLVLASRSFPRRTRHGAIEASRWKAFGSHLENCRLDTQGLELRDRYLPYAIALGVDRSWLSKFSSAAESTERSGVGPKGGPEPGSPGLRELLNAASSALASPGPTD